MYVCICLFMVFLIASRSATINYVECLIQSIMACSLCLLLLLRNNNPRCRSHSQLLFKLSVMYVSPTATGGDLFLGLGDQKIMDFGRMDRKNVFKQVCLRLVLNSS